MRLIIDSIQDGSLYHCEVVPKVQKRVFELLEKVEMELLSYPPHFRLRVKGLFLKQFMKGRMMRSIECYPGKTTLPRCDSIESRGFPLKLVPHLA